MDWPNEFPNDAKLVKYSEYSYHDPIFPHDLNIYVSETFTSSGYKVQAVVPDYLDWNKAPFNMTFSAQPVGWSSTVEAAISACVQSAKNLLIVNKPK